MASATDLMNRNYRHQRHFYDFTRKYFLLGRDRLIADLAPHAGDAVLEIGCGTGRNLIAAAHRYRDARLFGIDVSTEMLRSAIANISGAGLASQVRVAYADATRFDPQTLFGRARFERVFISYALSMITDWQAVLDRAIALLASTGELHIVDFGGQSQLRGVFRTMLRRCLRLGLVTPCDELEAALRSRAQPSGASLLFERPYRDYAQYAVLRLAG